MADGRALLHWHRRNQMWLPMGGHIEPNEDPVAAVLREVAEESGIAAEIIGAPPPLPFANIGQLPPPVAVLVAPVRSCSVAQRLGWSGPIEHIDLVYYCRPQPASARRSIDDPSLRWLTAGQLSRNQPHAPAEGEPPVPLTDDVRVLALEALRAARGR